MTHAHWRDAAEQVSGLCGRRLGVGCEAADEVGRGMGQRCGGRRLGDGHRELAAEGAGAAHGGRRRVGGDAATAEQTADPPRPGKVLPALAATGAAVPPIHPSVLDI